MNHEKKGGKGGCGGGKFMAVGMVVLTIAIALAGCSSLQNIYTGAKNMLCSPTESQKADAQQAVAFLEMAVKVVTGQDITAEVVVAKAIFKDVAASVCVGLDQLQAAVTSFDNVVVILKSQPTAPAPGVSPIVVPELANLRKVLKQ